MVEQVSQAESTHPKAQRLYNQLGLHCAEVAELADAQDLGSCGRKAVGVQLPPSAPKFPFGRFSPLHSTSKGLSTPRHRIFTCYSCAVEVYTLLSRTGGVRERPRLPRNRKTRDKERKRVPMRILTTICLVLLAPGLILAQASAPKPDSNTDNSTVANELKALREALADQQKQIARQQQEIDRLKQQAAKQDVSADAASGTPRIMDAALHTTTPAGVVSPAPNRMGQEQKKESPLSFKIGEADFTPGGFVDFENVFRTTNTGNVAATVFWTIPFSNTVQGHLTEYRATGQYSRFNIKTHAKYGQNDVTGYVEFDFNGNDAANVFVSANGHTDRLRLYWLDLKRGKWEFLGGQTWGLQTPNRVGVSPNPADLALTYGEDSQTHVGLNYTRAAEFRAAYHFNDNWVWAAAIQNPQQFVGQGETIFPFAFNAALGVQADAANNPGTPNLAPDLHTKLAYDNNFMGGRHFHFEAGGLMTTAKVTVLPTVAGSTFTSHSTLGGGVDAAMNFELWKGSDNRNFMFVGSGMYGYGVGRYLIGMGPQFVVRPVTVAGGVTCTSTGSGAAIVVTGNCDVAASGVHSGDAIVGFEFRPHPKTQFGLYGGAAYFQRNFFRDLTGGSAQPFIGFGFPGSSSSANRVIQEGTIDWTQTFWRNPQYGAVLLVMQSSYVRRAPWFVLAGAPKNAHLFVQYVSVRYVLP